MKLTTIRIPCANLADAKAFYTETLGLPEKFGSVELEYVGVDVGGVDLLLEPEEGDEFPAGRFLGISLVVDDIAETYARLRSHGVNFVAPPERQPWGGTLAHFEDDSGNILTLWGESDAGETSP